MPCDSSYMEANGREIALSRVLCLLEESRTRKPVDPSSTEWQGYHPKAYGKAVPTAQADAWVESLCTYLKSANNIYEHSLEMQLWWRDHQRADADKIAKKTAEKKMQAEREAVLAKLSPEERKALGLED